MIPSPTSGTTGRVPISLGREPVGADNRPFPIRLPLPHVLVIDPDIGSLDTFNRLFHGQGFFVTLSSNLLELDLVRALGPDIIILDMSWETHRAGVAFARRIQLDARLGRVSLLCVASDAGMANQLNGAGIRTLLKPVRPLDLFAAIDPEPVTPARTSA